MASNTYLNQIKTLFVKFFCDVTNYSQTRNGYVITLTAIISKKAHNIFPWSPEMVENI